MTQLEMLRAGGAPALRGSLHFHPGDWREQEPEWPRPFVLIMDPPYVAGESRRGSPGQRNLKRGCHGIGSTTERDDVMAVAGWDAAAVFGPGGGMRNERPWGDPRALLVVDKGEGVGMGDITLPWRPNYEMIAVYGRGWRGRRTTSVLKGRVLGFGRNSASNGRRHPHEKPLNVVAELVSKAPPGLPIVDPFLGSGTTAEACVLLGRECWGAEIDPDYHPIIRGRLKSLGNAELRGDDR